MMRTVTNLFYVGFLRVIKKILFHSSTRLWCSISSMSKRTLTVSGKSVDFDVHCHEIRYDVRNPISEFEVREQIVLETSQYVESVKEEMIHNTDTREPPCHFALRWEGNKKRSLIQVLDMDQVKNRLEKKNKLHELPRDYLTEDDSGFFVPVLALECRDLEPYAFHPRGGEFSVVSSGGFRFEPDKVDLRYGDWTDYDEEHRIAVSLCNFQAKFSVP